MKRALITVLLITSALWAQEFRSTISGRVLDPVQAVVPGVNITATEIETGAVTKAKSESGGQYTLPFLAPGHYRVVAEAQGFKQYLHDGITVSTNERLSLDIVLEIGQISESVTVNAEAGMVNTASASVGQVVTSAEVDNMPLNGRTPLALASLSFGVTPQGSPVFVRPFDNGRVSSISMGGAPSQSNELLFDGSPNTDATGSSAYSPPMDAVTEVKVEAFQTDAAYGHTGGGTVNMVSKSGTNGFHGSLYEFNQASALAATPFFTNRAGLRKPVTRYNQYGASTSGPVVLPKVFNGRNKLLYFFAFEGIKQPSLLPTTTTVPTAAERTGDFSQLLKINANYQVYDPLTGQQQGSRISRQPFPNNIIPTARINPVANRFLQYYPAPNQPGQVDGQNNYVSNTTTKEDFDNEVGRLDYNSSDMNKMFFSIRHSERRNQADQLFDNFATGKHVLRQNWGTTLDDVLTISPSVVLDTRANWTRYVVTQTRLSEGFDFSTLGFPASLMAASADPLLPNMVLKPYNNLGDVGSLLTPYDSFQVFSSLMKIAGTHTLKAGADLRLARQSNYNFGYSAGQYTFSTNWTRGPLDSSGSAPIGQEMASFLLGLPSSGTFDTNAGQSTQSGYYALFLQDDWRVRPNLTLNLGLRYERDLPTTERYNRVVNGFDPTASLAITAAAQAAYAKNPIPQVPVSAFNPIGGLLFPGSGNRGIYSTPAGNFSPRFGVSWTPSALRGTVLRAGAGMFYFPLGLTGINQTGFNQSTPLVATTNGYLTPNVTLSNPFPNGIMAPTGASLGANTFVGQGVIFFNPSPQSSYSTRWNFDIQRQLKQNMALEVGYTGNHAVHLRIDRNLDYTPAQYLSTTGARDQATIDFLSANLPNPFAGLLPGTTLNGSTVSRSQLLQRFPQFTGVTMQGDTEGSSYFHALQVRLEKRFSAGLQLNLNYQYSRLIDKIDRLNDSDPGLEKRVADEDRPQRVVLNGSYQLPFGKGKAFGSGSGRLVNGIIGGWALSGIYTFQTGAPIAWGDMIYYGGDLQYDARNINRAFDTSQFNTNSKQQLGSDIRTFPTTFSNLHGDNVNNLDFSMLKNIPIHERFRVQYRCEFFNGLNHANFDLPSAAPGKSSFATITKQANQPRVIQMGLRVAW
jgi:hypothetical protein